MTALLVNAAAPFGIKLTADTAGIRFCAAGYDLLKDANIIKDGRGASVVGLPGNGYESDVKYQEGELSVHRGNTNKLLLPEQFYSEASDVATSGTYTIYTLEYVDGRSNAIGGGEIPTAKEAIMFAVPSTVSTFPTANFIARLAQIPA